MADPLDPKLACELHRQSLTSELEALLDHTGGQAITIGEAMRVMRHRGTAMAMLLATLPCVIPGLASALAVGKVFPPLLVHLIASGEKTGDLPPMLDRAADSLAKDIERRAMGMTALLEPLMIVVMGAVVLLIVMAVLMPIIEINQLVQ